MLPMSKQNRLTERPTLLDCFFKVFLRQPHGFPRRPHHGCFLPDSLSLSLSLSPLKRSQCWTHCPPPLFVVYRLLLLPKPTLGWRLRERECESVYVHWCIRTELTAVCVLDSPGRNCWCMRCEREWMFVSFFRVLLSSFFFHSFSPFFFSFFPSNFHFAPWEELLQNFSLAFSAKRQFAC